MINCPSYRFTVSLSKEEYKDKKICKAMIGSLKTQNNRDIRKEYGFDSRKGISFIETELSSEELLNYLKSGRVFCHLFNPQVRRKDNSFGSYEKRNSNFIGSYVVGVDIDKTNYRSVEDYVSKLSLKPTFWYTSYSSSDTALKFRLIYVFDNLIENPYYFRFIAWCLNKRIESEVNEVLEDQCNLSCSQYFNGTNNSSSGITNLIYNHYDIIGNNSFVEFLKDNAKYKTKNPERDNDINIILNNIYNNTYSIYNISFPPRPLNDKMENAHNPLDSEIEEVLFYWDRLSEDEFKRESSWIKLRSTTKYYYRLEKDWISDSYQFIDENYFSLFYYPEKQLDGQKRRKNLYQRICLRRLLNENITVKESIVNTIIDILKFYDNSDRELDSNFIVRNTLSAFDLTLEEIELNFKDQLDYLRSTTKPKKGVIYKLKSKEYSYLILDDLYDPSLTVKENLININAVYPVQKSTLYNYLKTRKIESKKNIISDEEIISLLDLSLSANSNYKRLKESGIKIDNKRLNRIYKFLKNYEYN